MNDLYRSEFGSCEELSHLNIKLVTSLGNNNYHYSLISL